MTSGSNGMPGIATRMLASAGLAMILCGSLLHAKDLYVAQTAAGEHVGSSCANALSVAWLNDPAHWRRGPRDVAAGDTVHLCGTITTPLRPYGDGDARAPITIFFERYAKISAPTLWDASLKIGSGIDLNGRHYFVVDGGSNGVIEATSNGTPGTHQHSDNLTGISTNRAGNITIRRVSILGMYARTPGSNDANKYGCGTWGTSMTGANIFENNRVQDANCGVQWSTRRSTGGTMIVRGNAMSRVSWGFASGGEGIVHLKFYGNDLSDGYVWSGRIATGDGHFHNDPFHIWISDPATSFPDLVIFDNRIHGSWGDNTTGGFYFECNGTAESCPAIIYNNIVDTTTGFTNGAIALKHAEDVKIFNNVFASPGNAIHIENSRWGDPATPSRLVDVKNNLFYAVGVPLTASGTSSFGTISHNAYWKTSAGKDNHPTKGNPRVDAATFIPQPGSPLIGSGLDLSSYFNLDRRGAMRPQGRGWDIGAFQMESESIAQPTAGSAIGARE